MSGELCFSAGGAEKRGGACSRFHLLPRERLAEQRIFPGRGYRTTAGTTGWVIETRNFCGTYEMGRRKVLVHSADGQECLRWGREAKVHGHSNVHRNDNEGNWCTSPLGHDFPGPRQGGGDGRQVGNLCAVGFEATIQS